MGEETAVASAILPGYYDHYIDDSFVADGYRSGYELLSNSASLFVIIIDPNGERAGIEAASLPIMFNSYNDDCPIDHTNVTYGYSQTIAGTTGHPLATYYHVHNGWRGDERLATYNFAWFADAMYFVPIYQ